jgi:peptide/nickel transport system ATP-binding protein
MKDVSLAISAGEILCVVGESGSGQVDDRQQRSCGCCRPGCPSTAAAWCCSAARPDAKLPEAEMRAMRGAGIAMIFQEPMTALNPLRTIGDQIGEMFAHPYEASMRARPSPSAACWPLLARSASRPEAARCAPIRTKLSGGQRQRAMIAMALALESERC